MGRVSWLSFSSRRVRTKKTVRLVAVFSFVTVVEFIVETQAPRNHFRFTIDAAIFGKKKAEIKVLYCSRELVEEIVQ